MRTAEEKSRLDKLVEELRIQMNELFEVGKNVDCCGIHRRAIYLTYLELAEKVVLILAAGRDNTSIQMVEALGAELIKEIKSATDLTKQFLKDRESGQPLPIPTQMMPRSIM